MIVRNCAGGIVFFEENVFLLRNDKAEWILPKGVVRDKKRPEQVALERVKIETGLDAHIIAPAGSTQYEFYSRTRRQSVCNRVLWYLMRADSARYRICFEQGFTDGDWFPFAVAVEQITYSQDRSLLQAVCALLKASGGAESGV